MVDPRRRLLARRPQCEIHVHSPLVDDIRFVGLQDGSIRRFPMEERGCVSEGMLVPLAQCAEGVDGGVEDASK
jgi:hypothetical protein